MRNRWVRFWLGVTITALSPMATAADRGLVVAQGAIEPDGRGALLSEIERARRTNPEVFSRIEEIVGAYPDYSNGVDRSGRVRIAPLLMAFRADGLYPMLEILAIREPKLRDLDESYRLQLRKEITYAVGMLRDDRSVSVLAAIVRGDEVDQAVRDEAAVGIGKLRTVEAVNILLAVLDDDGVSLPAKRAAYVGLGRCYRLIAAERLAEAIRTRPDSGTAAVIAWALGAVANASVWKVLPEEIRVHEEDDTRRIATEALLWSFLQYDDPGTRLAVTHAIRVVRHWSTLERIAVLQAGAESPEKADLADLEMQFLSYLEFVDRDR